LPLILALGLGGFFALLASQDPLRVATLTSAQRSAGYLSTELEVNGTDCRFCRIHVERTLKEIPGVKVAKADMAHHRARVVYDPALVQPPALLSALRELGLGAGFSEHQL
jgi:P-type Cu2+ transporter